MNYVLAIHSPNFGSQATSLAYQFAQALLAADHQISQVFFFQAGVSHGNSLADFSTDEICPAKIWRDLAQTHQIPLHLCISAAARRGVVEQNLAEGFVLAGLGEFSRAVLEADRLMTF